MSEDVTSAVELPFRHRVRYGVRQPQNWLQLFQFGAVGATGYVVNLVAFTICVHLLKIDYKIASPIAFVVSVVNNYWWNRHWTFRDTKAHAVEQGVKFFVVSLVAFGFSYVILISLVDGAGFAKVVAQAISIAAALPLSFIGQKLWSFASS
jgi:dolichol-phosphate mannosyltransferase